MSSPAPPRLPAGERLRRAGIAAWSLIGLAIVLAGSVWALFRISVIFPPLVLALLIIYTLNPLVSGLERRGVPRVVSAIGSYILAAGLVTAAAFLLTPLISAQVENFSEDWPRFRDDLVTFVDDTAASLNERLGTEFRTTQFDCLLGADESAQLDAPSTERCDEVTRDFRDLLTAQASRATEIGSSVLEVLLVFIIGPLIALYLLIDLPQLRRDLLNLVPETHREEFADVGSKIGRAVGGFFRGQLFVAVTVGLLSALGFFIIDLPFWFLIGAIAGFFNLIPLVGPFIGGAIGFLVGTVTGGVGLGLQAALVELVVQQLDNHFISPNVMRRTVQIHPVTVMLALLAGGALSGFWGVLLAVPTVAVGKLMLGHVWETRVLGAEVSPYTPASSRAPSATPESTATVRERAEETPTRTSP
ncbi:MAG: AI-2E family transporter [Actinomycetota bacterium]